MGKTDWTKIIGAILGIVLLTLQTTNTQRMTRVETNTMPTSTIESHINSIDTRMITLEDNLMNKTTIMAHIDDMEETQKSHEAELEKLRNFVMDKEIIDKHLNAIDSRVNKLENK